MLPKAMRGFAVVAIAVALATMPPSASADGDPLVLPVGVDLYSIPSGSVVLAVPADFFAPGSLPVSSTVALEGLHLGAAGAWELGTTDALVNRRTGIDMAPAPSAQTVVVQFAHLSMVSTSPVVVTVGTESQSWGLSLGLDPDASLSPCGTMSLTRSGDDSGTFSISVPVVPKLTFTRAGVTKTLVLPETTLTGPTGSWSPRSSSPTAGIYASRLATGLSLGATLSSTNLSMTLTPPGAVSHPGPSFVAGTAVVHPTAKLARYCSVDSNSQVLAGAVVGPSASIGSNVTIGAESVIGANAVIADGCTIGARAVLGDGCTLAAGATVGTDSWIHDGTDLGAGAGVGSSCFVGRDCTIGANCSVSNSVVLSDNVSLGANCAVSQGLIVSTGASVPASTALTECFLTYVNDAGGAAAAALSDMPSSGIIIPANDMALSCAVSQISISTPPIVASVTPYGPLPGGYRDGLGGDIGDDVAPPKGGGTGSPYAPGTNDCRHFARDLYNKLTALGYSTTFTITWKVRRTTLFEKLTGEGNWIKVRDTGHCQVDIHKDGKVFWLEAQRAGTGAIDHPWTDHDKNGDGKVGYDTKPGDAPTDGDSHRVEVYSSYAAAKAANPGTLP